MRGRVVVLGLFVCAAVANAQQVFRTETGFGSNHKSIVDFTTIRSTSGRYEMSIDPTERFGAGSATYRLKCDGQERWTKELPFTLRVAVLADDGVTCGYAYTEGPFPRALGKLRIGVIDANGAVRCEHSWERQHSRFEHAPPTPQAYGVWCEAALDRFSVLVHSTAEDPITEWWTFRLSNGERIEHAEPSLEVPELRRRNADAPWEPPPPLDEIVFDHAGMTSLDRGEPLRSWIHSRRLRDLRADGSFLTFDEAEGGCLSVHHRSRTGANRFEHVIESWPPTEDRSESRLMRVGAVEIDSLGRALVLDACSGCLHVFGTDGERVFVARPASGEAFATGWFGGSKADSVGGLCVSLATHLQIDITTPFYARFDSTGKRTGMVRCVGPLIAALPGGAHWQGGGFLDGPLALVDERGQIERTVDRTPDGHWLRRVCGGTLDPSGHLVVVTEDSLVFVGPADFVGPEDSVEAIRFQPPSPFSLDLAATNDWVLIPEWSIGSVTLFSRRDWKFLRWSNPIAHLSDRWSYGFSADGKELLALEAPALVIHRFALP